MNKVFLVQLFVIIGCILCLDFNFLLNKERHLNVEVKTRDRKRSLLLEDVRLKNEKEQKASLGEEQINVV